MQIMDADDWAAQIIDVNLGFVYLFVQVPPWHEGWNMLIIDITNPREIPHTSHCYVAEPSAEVVALAHHQRFGYVPDVMYRRVAANGRVSWYVPSEEPKSQ